MKLFDFFTNKRAATQDSQQKSARKSQLQTFILEPILTPSGLMDGGDDALIPLVLNDSADQAPNFELDLDIETTDLLLESISEAIADGDIEPLDFISGDGVDASLANPSTGFDSGVFTVGETGVVDIDFLFDGGRFEGELAIFSLEGMEQFEPGSQAFIQEAARRALSNSEFGHVAIADSTEGARFSPGETNLNPGEYRGVKTFLMRPGDEFGVMLVPRGSVQEVLNNPDIIGTQRPLFSMGTANPNDGFSAGQIVDVNGKGDTFAFEEWRVDVGFERDYEDIVFEVRGATGKAVLLDQAIDPINDWRDSPLGQEILDYATNPRFESGVFTVGKSGEVGIDFLFDGGGFRGELAIFSLEDMGDFEPGSQAFMQEAARRALSNSEFGYVAIGDRTEGARFSANLDQLRSFNAGQYLGVKTFLMRPGDEFGVMLVPNGTVLEVFNNPAIQGDKHPLFSMATDNTNDVFFGGQIVDVTDKGDTFAFEDLRVDLSSDRDYNDIIFQVRGARGKAVLINGAIDPVDDWRGSPQGQELLNYAVVNSVEYEPVAPALAPDPANDGDVIVIDQRIGEFLVRDIDSDEVVPEALVNNGNAIASVPVNDEDALIEAPFIEIQEVAPNLADDDQLFVGNPLRGGDVVVEDTPGPGEEVVIAPVEPEQVEFSQSNQPLVGIIDTGFSTESAALNDRRILLGSDRVGGDANPLLSAGEGDQHGTAILAAIAAAVGVVGTTQDDRPEAPPLWLGRGIGSGSWAESLLEFVDAAKRSGQRNAVINLSFDLTQINPDGSITTRYELTPEEWAALRYAQQNGVLIVAAAGNQGGAISALGQASREFDNIITVGAADGLERADYSSYGSGLDI